MEETGHINRRPSVTAHNQAAPSHTTLSLSTVLTLPPRPFSALGPKWSSKDTHGPPPGVRGHELTHPRQPGEGPARSPGPRPGRAPTLVPASQRPDRGNRSSGQGFLIGLSPPCPAQLWDLENKCLGEKTNRVFETPPDL